MIIYKYMQYGQEYEEKMECSAEEAVESAIRDIEYNRAMPCNISDENGSIIYTKDQIDEMFDHGGVIVESTPQVRLIE